MKTPVLFIGLQEDGKGGYLVLVNNAGHSTVVYDPAKHDMVNEEDFAEAKLSITNQNLGKFLVACFAGLIFFGVLAWVQAVLG